MPCKTFVGLPRVLCTVFCNNCSDDENTTNPKVTIDQEDLDFDVSTSVEIKTEPKLSTEYTKITSDFTSKSNRDEDNLDRMMSRITMNEEVDIDSIDMGNSPIFENNRHIEVQLPLDNDFPLWAGDTSARRSPEGIT